MDSEIVVKLILPLALFTIMLGVGMSLKLSEFKLFWHQPSIIAVGVLTQLAVLPLLGLIVISLFQLTPICAVGILIVTFAPGGATSNMLTFLAKGDTALSVCITAVAGVVTPFTMPLFTVLAMSFFLDQNLMIEFPVFITVLKLFVMSVVPVFIGVYIQYRWPELCQKSEHYIKLLACLFLLMVVCYIVYTNWSRFPLLVSLLGPSVLFLIVTAMLIGYLIAKYMNLNSEKRVTMAMEIGIQNAAIALMMTGGILQNEEMAASALIYGVLMNVPAFILVVYRNRDRRTLIRKMG